MPRGTEVAVKLKEVIVGGERSLGGSLLQFLTRVDEASIMSIAAKRRGKTLSNYEQRQVEKIASWKGSYPNPFAELFHEVARPLSRFIQFLVPDALALGAIEAAYKASELSATQADIQLQAGVRGHPRTSPCVPGNLRSPLSPGRHHGPGSRDRRGRLHRGWRRLDHAARHSLCSSRCACGPSSRRAIAMATRSIDPRTRRGSWVPWRWRFPIRKNAGMNSWAASGRSRICCSRTFRRTSSSRRPPR